MTQDNGVTPSGSGSREPDQQAVPAVPASIPDAPVFFFTPHAGLVADLGDQRSVSLSIGRDDHGARRWALTCLNSGHETKNGFSDEAMDAIVQIYVELTRVDLDVEAGVQSWETWEWRAATQGIETGTAKTEGLGPKDESPVAESDAPNSSQGDQP